MKLTTTSFHKAFITLTVALFASACGKIPKSYQGNYVDSNTGAKLTLSGSDGTLTTQDGRTLKSEANTLDYGALLKGQSGIYLRPSESDQDVIEIFWLLPKPETRKTENNFVWMSSEVLYTRMNTRHKNAVPNLEMVHCENGTIMLDLPSNTWNGGCPAERTDYRFLRR